jgi:hypothetical protein
MKTKEDACLALGRTFTVLGHTRTFELYRGGGSRNFILFSYGKHTVPQIVEGLTRLYPPGSFALYRCHVLSCTIKKYWL